MEDSKCICIYLFMEHNNLKDKMNCSFKIGFFIVDNFLDDGGKSILFGVLDGHGGSDVVEFVRSNFTQVLIWTFPSTAHYIVHSNRNSLRSTKGLLKILLIPSNEHFFEYVIQKFQPF